MRFVLPKTQGYPKRVLLWFALLACVASFVAGIMLVDTFRVYRSEALLLVIAKSEQGAEESEAAVDALIAFSETRDFVADSADELGGYDVFRSGDFEVRKLGKPAVEVAFTAEDPLDAEEAVRNMSLRLFEIASRYYDVRNNFDFRIVPGIETVPTISNIAGFVFSAVMWGVIAAGVLFGVTLAGARYAFSLQGKEKRESMNVDFDLMPEEVHAEKKEEIKVIPVDRFVPKKPEPKVFPFGAALEAESSVDYGHFHRGPAPANLPIVSEEDVLNMFVAKESSPKNEATQDIVEEEGEVSTEEKTDEESNDREPTPEEYKRRLNELLSGKMPQ